MALGRGSVKNAHRLDAQHSHECGVLTSEAEEAGLELEVLEEPDAESLEAFQPGV